MKVAGIIRNCDNLGRVVIPKELRKAFEIKDGDPVEIYAQDDAIVLKKYIPSYDLKTKIENAITSLKDLAEYKGLEYEDTKKINDHLGLALLEFEKLEINSGK
ncbi:transcriptional pleiotropic regulator of transition state genes [Lachnotalea glycerini]|uniref:AbrB/MazE/SpoVT family DNA-binding domain-containing protein n=1 Tax=Lachnotalea glycerini TaxID=1763509 RepID=A0A255IDN8_9FIRM|nr:AbrB/MazE/SpoVT family DNA-binding domain-containing protein [Lachnotalea glycerini]PXV85925.1 transcriptional pleiotropic regulator of transition state genes [Lachnotalea glycerini]RDY29808.1 AbrB/MazE/SpoVT family DNA-binding domain-containing protein [Lachnotalea glycerini]